MNSIRYLFYKPLQSSPFYAKIEWTKTTDFMAQTKEGVIKCAAKKAGITVSEYLERTEAGLKKCTYCKRWKQKKFFVKDHSRFDGLKSKCYECDYKPKTNNVGVRERRLMNRKGLSWCRKCHQWLKSELVSKNGLCKPHEAEDARIRYATNETYRRERQQHAHSRRRKCEPIKPKVQLEVLAEFDERCAYCHSPATTFDHIIPISKHGNSEKRNVVPSCVSCNSSKKNKDVLEWIVIKNISVSTQLAQRLKQLF